MKNPFNKLGKYITVARINMALVVLLLVFALYVLFAPLTPATYNTPQVRNSSSLVAGQMLTYSIYTCRHVGEGVPTTITRQLIPVNNDELQPILLSTDVVTNPKGCRTSVRTLIIPYSTPAGEYKLLIRGVYSVVPVRQPIPVEAVSDKFSVKTGTVNDQIIYLTDMNQQLQNQLDNGMTNQSSTPDTITRPTTNNRSSSQTTTNNSSTTNNTTNNNNQDTPANDDGTIQNIIKALGGSPIIPKL